MKIILKGFFWCSIVLKIATSTLAQLYLFFAKFDQLVSFAFEFFTKPFILSLNELLFLLNSLFTELLIQHSKAKLTPKLLTKASLYLIVPFWYTLMVSLSSHGSYFGKKQSRQNTHGETKQPYNNAAEPMKA